MSTIDRGAAPVSRRRFLAAAATACAVSAVGRLAAAADSSSPPRSKMGMATNAWDLHQKVQVARGEKGDLSDPLLFLQRCDRLGAAGMQGPLGIRDEQYTAALRRWAEAHEIFIEGSIDLSGGRIDFDRVEKQLLTAKAAGARVVRAVVIPGRRYEQFDSLDGFTAASQRAMETLRRVEPLVTKHSLRLAVENHKDHRVEERLDLLRRLGSERIGICVDAGNSFSLCEDPLEVIRAYAPFAMTVHIKDQAVREYEQGFLFGDAALGQGFLDLPEMVRILRKANPQICFCFETITRDPLRVPVLTSKYWATMPNVPASDLARTMRIVREKSAREPLPTIAGLPIDKQAERELLNATTSLEYARTRLQL